MPIDENTLKQIESKLKDMDTHFIKIILENLPDEIRDEFFKKYFN